MPDREPCRRCGYVLDTTINPLTENGLCPTCDEIEARKNEEAWRDP